MAQAPNAILAINSLDRYPPTAGLTSVDSANFYKILLPYIPTNSLSNNFQITSGGAIIYGYINKMIVSQIQFNYNVPTVIPNKNNVIIISWLVESDPPTFPISYVQENVPISIPYGFYTPEELVAVLTTIILQTDIVNTAPNFNVSYDQAGNVFVFNAGIGATMGGFWFQIADDVILGQLEISPVLLARTYNMLGIGKQNTNPTAPSLVQRGVNAINFLYTPYVDIISEVLTKYQNVKDTDTSINKLNSIIARLYLTGVGIPQAVDGTPVGSKSFMIVQDMNSPKVIRWSPNEAVNSFDIQVRDQYGDLLFCQSPEQDGITTYYSEFQMTLLCIESERY